MTRPCTLERTSGSPRGWPKIFRELRGLTGPQSPPPPLSEPFFVMVLLFYPRAQLYWSFAAFRPCMSRCIRRLRALKNPIYCLYCQLEERDARCRTLWVYIQSRFEVMKAAAGRLVRSCCGWGYWVVEAHGFAF